MTAASLRELTRKDLATRAKKSQIVGWHEMTKDELVAALAAVYRRQRGRNGVPSSRKGDRPVARTRSRLQSTELNSNAAPPRSFRTSPLGGPVHGRRTADATVRAPAPNAVQDTLIAAANHPCWIHVRWTLSRDTLVRAQVAMGVHWHKTVPILRILDVTGDDAGASPQVRVRDVEIHGDVDHWYLPVENAPRCYKVQIGYRAPNGLFFILAQSKRVQTPRPGSHSLRLRETDGARNSKGGGPVLELEKRPSYDLRALPTAQLRNGNGSVDSGDEPHATPPIELRLHAELIIHGTTDPSAELTLQGDHVRVSRDGAFSHRFALPEGRQVIDAVVATRDGCHQRTIVLGIERNTKELEPQWFNELNP